MAQTLNLPTLDDALKIIQDNKASAAGKDTAQPADHPAPQARQPAPGERTQDSAPTLASEIAKIHALDSSIDKSAKSYQEKLSQGIAAAEKLIAEPVPKLNLQKIADVPHEQAVYKAKAFHQFLPWLVGFAVLGGLLTRRPLVTALNAFAAGLTGFQQGHDERYAQAYNEWHAEVSRAIENNQEMLQQYANIMKSRQLNLSQKMAQLNLAAKAYEDELFGKQVESGNLDTVLKALETKQLASERFLAAFSHFSSRLAPAQPSKQDFDQAAAMLKNDPIYKQAFSNSGLGDPNQAGTQAFFLARALALQAKQYSQQTGVDYTHALMSVYGSTIHEYLQFTPHDTWLGVQKIPSIGAAYPPGQ